MERKGIDAIPFPNMRAYVIASNETHVVPAGAGARRFAVLKVNESRKEDRAYFASLAEELENGGRIEMLRYLLQEDFSDVNVYAAPKTDALFEQKLLSMSSAERYWFDLLKNARIPNITAPDSIWSETEEASIQVNHALADYLSSPYMVNAHSQAKRAAETELGVTLGRLIPSRRKRRLRGPEGARFYAWILPSLAEARTEWQQQYGDEHSWDSA